MQDNNILQIIMEGVSLPEFDQIKNWTEEEKRVVEMNAKAMNSLFCALSPEELNRVSKCKITKEI